MLRSIIVVSAVLVVAGCSKPTSDKLSGVSEAATPTTPVVFNAAQAPTVEFSVPDMMCPEGCGVKIKEILAEQPGAKEVLVDFDSKTATVAVEEGKFDSQKAIAALVDHSFGQSTLKGDAAAKPQADAAPVVH
jgi:copper chaperone CopZ